MNRPLRIGVLSLVQVNWSASRSYSRVVMESLKCAARIGEIEIVHIVGDERDAADGVEVARVATPDLSMRGKILRNALPIRDRLPVSSGEFALRTRVGLIDRSNPLHVALSHEVDVVLPVTVPRGLGLPLARVGWISDFQHRRLPDYFSASERDARDRMFIELARECQVVVVSSEAARRDFLEALPMVSARVEVAKFPSRYAFTAPREEPGPVIARYSLPRKFALVANQFWAHKNHQIVINALAALRRDGVEVHVVFTGMPDDYRDPPNRYLSEVFQLVAIHGLAGQVHLLGEVREDELDALMRSAALIIQPSRFEGWSTVMQDALALGRSVACTDIDVLREQAPSALFFFGPDDAEGLALQLGKCWACMAPGPDVAAEEHALAASRAQATTFGSTLLGACRRAHSTRLGTPDEPAQNTQ